ncbi:hypothetical protein LSH36_63g10042 [Paralvinella palmiformis]|uniref:Nuclear receptor 2C2-associated protein n=1 Tax=Paralvinella palmiformis TaxID=53620 RepID=A0AAD9NDE3_9ANNE|nr:hypothetical protein LSH36_63g10042 [Paralvinella palmiformis]
MQVLDLKEGISLRVSSVLNRDVKQFGKKHLIDDDDETCWNSDQGTPQWIQVDFPGLVSLQEVHLQFQGGFVGKDCYIEGTLNGITSRLLEFYPEDINSNQVFQISCSDRVSSIKIVFSSSTDFFGRIILYKLNMFGTKIS